MERHKSGTSRKVRTRAVEIDETLSQLNQAVASKPELVCPARSRSLSLSKGRRRAVQGSGTGAETSEPAMTRQLTAIIEREDDGYVALCPELDVASQGTTVSEARDNLKEALELFLETASDTEIKQRLHEELKQGNMDAQDRQDKGGKPQKWNKQGVQGSATQDVGCDETL